MRTQLSGRVIVGLMLIVGLCISCQKSQQCGKTCSTGEIKISKSTLEDKIKGGWLGKTAGVCVGGPTEFKAKGKMFTGPVNLYPSFESGFNQDDIYVQITFIEAMDAKLADPDGIFAATMDDYGEAFKKSGYELWHANKAGRNNLRKGIKPPQSGMWAGRVNASINAPMISTGRLSATGSA